MLLVIQQSVRCSFAGIAIMVAFFGAFPASSGAQTRKALDRPVVEMVIEKRGAVRIELLPQEAPRTVAHFISLVERKFYDGILFHRVEPKLVAQAGDPGSRKIDGTKIASLTPSEVAQLYRLGLGGSGKSVALEASAPCTRGTLGLGHSLDPDSGDSQFFFNLSDNHRLDNQYTVFGRVTRGLEVMDAIQQGDRIKTIRRVAPPRKRR